MTKRSIYNRITLLFLTSCISEPSSCLAFQQMALPLRSRALPTTTIGKENSYSRLSQRRSNLQHDFTFAKKSHDGANCRTCVGPSSRDILLLRAIVSDEETLSNNNNENSSDYTGTTPFEIQSSEYFDDDISKGERADFNLNGKRIRRRRRRRDGKGIAIGSNDDGVGGILALRRPKWRKRRRRLRASLRMSEKERNNVLPKNITCEEEEIDFSYNLDEEFGRSSLSENVSESSAVQSTVRPGPWGRFRIRQGSSINKGGRPIDSRVRKEEASSLLESEKDAEMIASPKESAAVRLQRKINGTSIGSGQQIARWRKHRRRQRRDSRSCDGRSESFTDSVYSSSETSFGESTSVKAAINAKDKTPAKDNVQTTDSLTNSNATKIDTISARVESLLPESAPEATKAKLAEDNEKQPALGKKGSGKRVVFSATHQSTRILNLDSEMSTLFTQYMTQPVEQYSVKSFHDVEIDDTSVMGTTKATTDSTVKSRRWLVRRLSADEVARNQSRKKFSRDDDDNESEDGVILHEINTDNLFRLAVPLMPLIGLDLTPIIDLEVMPPSTTRESNSVSRVNGNKTDNSERTSKSAHEGIKEKNQMNNPLGRVLRRRARNRERIHSPKNEDDDTIRIKSLRVSLLSQENEVRNVMQTRSGKKKLKPKEPEATAVSRNESVQKMGYEAIGLASKIEEWLRPKLSFEASITWCDGSSAENENRNESALFIRNQKKNSRSEGASVTVKSTVSTSLTIPPLPVAVPLPSTLLVKRIGSIITKRALALALPRFLTQLENDFKRWASVDKSVKKQNLKRKSRSN